MTELYVSSMQIPVNWGSDVAEKLPELAICVGAVTGVHNEKENPRIEQLKKALYEEVRAKHSIETLKDNPTVRACRDFYWKLGIDPTKTRPSGEALLRRVLHGDNLPCISTIVDAYNLASMKTIVPISGFDVDSLRPPLQIRFAGNDEAFTGIGMSKPLTLTDRTLVLADEEQVLCVYPYRTRITPK